MTQSGHSLDYEVQMVCVPKTRISGPLAWSKKHDQAKMRCRLQEAAAFTNLTGVKSCHPRKRQIGPKGGIPFQIPVAFELSIRAGEANLLGWWGPHP